MNTRSQDEHFDDTLKAGDATTPVSPALTDDVAINTISTLDVTTYKKKLGGVTGKGFMPGKSGNPSGRPKQRLISDAYATLLEHPEEALGVARAIINAARLGNVAAAKELADRVEGPIYRDPNDAVPIELNVSVQVVGQ